MENVSSDDLAAITQARSALADRLVTPWWYHPVLGLIIGAYIVALGLGGTLVRLIGLALYLGALLLLARAYQELTGVWANGLSQGPAKRWSVALGLSAAAGAGVSVAFGELTGMTWPIWGLAAVMVVVTVILGHRYDTALRAHLREPV